MKHPIARFGIGVAAALVAVLQVLSAVQVGDHPYAGYRTDTNRVVSEVTRGGPAARAGLRIGDRITRIGGITADDTRRQGAQPRAGIGESRDHRETDSPRRSVTGGPSPRGDASGIQMGAGPTPRRRRVRSTDRSAACRRSIGAWLSIESPQARWERPWREAPRAMLRVQVRRRSACVARAGTDGSAVQTRRGYGPLPELHTPS